MPPVICSKASAATSWCANWSSCTAARPRSTPAWRQGRSDTAARLQRDEFWPGARQGLTQRESEILSFVVNGLSNRAIATKLVIGDETVKTHLQSIYRKLGVSDRTGAVATALREGIYQ